MDGVKLTNSSFLSVDKVVLLVEGGGMREIRWDKECCGFYTINPATLVNFGALAHFCGAGGGGGESPGGKEKRQDRLSTARPSQHG